MKVRSTAILLFFILLLALTKRSAATSLYLGDMPRLEEQESLALRFEDGSLKKALGAGWRLVDSSLLFTDEKSYRATSIEAEISLRILQARELILHLKMSPRFVKEYGEQWVDICLNGNRLGRCAFAPNKGWSTQDFEILLPASFQKHGENILHFMSRYALSSQDLHPEGAGEDSRPMAFGLESLLLCPPGQENPKRPAPQVVSVNNKNLKQAPGTRVRIPFLVSKTQPGNLLLDGLSGEGKATLSWDTLSGPAEQVLSLKTPLTLSLEQCAGSHAQLILETRADAGPVVWQNPRIETLEAQPPQAAMRPPRARPTGVQGVVVICLDALRADALGRRGALRDTSPFIDGLIESGIVYENVYSHASWTYPSMVSLFTGHFPPEHGVHYVNQILKDPVPLIGEGLLEKGVKTGCIAENPFFDKRYKLNRGFERYTYIYPAQAQGDTRSSEEITQAALDFLKGNKEEKFFLYVHYFPPHAPYAKANPFFQSFTLDPVERIPPEDIPMHTVEIGGAARSREGVAQLRARYDENVRYCDEQVRSLFSGIQSLGLGDETTVILLSDHGESFSDKGPYLGHSDPPYESQIRIPFLMTRASGSAEEAEHRLEVVRSIDLFPTLYDLFDAPIPENLPGLSLFSESPTLLEPVFNYAQSQSEDPIEAFYCQDYKILLDSAGARIEVYDLKNDPTEQCDLFYQRPALSAFLKARALAWKKNHPLLKAVSAAGATHDLDNDAVNELKALGYL